MPQQPYYAETPLERIVDVHWKKKDEPPPDGGDGGGGEPDPYSLCGAFMNGTLGGVPIAFSGIYILDLWYMYTRIRDDRLGHAPDKPWQYFPCFQDYVPGVTPWLPYIWSQPSSWTLEVRAFAPDGITPRAARIKEYRNINIQVFDFDVSPDRIWGNVAEIKNIQEGETYPPVFMCEVNVNGTWTGMVYPDVLVQAHCKRETTGTWTEYDPAVMAAGLPPQPDGWGTFFDPHTLIPYPAPGSTNDPIRPPPPPGGSPPPPTRISRLVRGC